MTKQVPRHESICVAAGEGPGGFQVTGMIECGQKSNPENSLGLPTKPKTITGPKKHSKLNVCVCFFIIPSEVII